MEVVNSNDETVKETETKGKSVMKTVSLSLVLLLFYQSFHKRNFGGTYLFGVCISYLLYGRRKPTPAKTNAK